MHRDLYYQYIIGNIFYDLNFPGVRPCELVAGHPYFGLAQEAALINTYAAKIKANISRFIIVYLRFGVYGLRRFSANSTLYTRSLYNTFIKVLVKLLSIASK